MCSQWVIFNISSIQNMSITNRWEEEIYIGQGGYSEVYRVKQNGKYYALKKIFPSVVKRPILREGIQREIKIMEDLDHPRIIKLHEAIIQQDEISLLLEYAKRGSVHDQLKMYGKLPEHQVKQYVKDLIEALEYLHNRKSPILHRDIKPENLLIGEDHHCRLADFGSANILDGQRLSYVGTEDYMAPEIISRQPHGVPYDVWCVGILIYQLLTGQVWKENQVYPAFLSRASEDVIKKILVKDQQKRMTIAELKQHIWLCDDTRRMRKMSSSNRVNKLEQMKKRVKAYLKEQSQVSKTKPMEEQSFKKEKSMIEQSKELNQKSNEYIQLLQERQRLKEQIMKNQKRIERQERRRRIERPYLLQQIDRLKCLLRQYENNISILKVKPLKKQAECKQYIHMLEKRVEDLTQYVKRLPQRIKSDLLYFSDYEPQPQILPVREYILKMKTEMLINHRDALIQLITSKKANNEIHQMIEIHNTFHMNESHLENKAEKVEEPRESSAVIIDNDKKKTL